MSWRKLLLECLFLLLTAAGVVAFQPGLVGLQSASSASLAPPYDPSRFNFVQSGNELGDRIYLTANAGVSLAPQPTRPDRISITPSDGARPGTFRFTIAPHQGSRGIRRAIGEFETTGQVFRLCEAVDDPLGDVPIRAERFLPVNNWGTHFALPEPMPAEMFGALITAAVNGAPSGSNGLDVFPGSETQRLAETLVGLCSG
jgi:hypothetical protein